MSKYESTSYLCTLFDIQCCQSVIRKLVYGFMCRLDSSVNCIIKGILATSLRYTSRIRKHLCSLLYYILIVDRSIYVFHIVYNSHVMLMIVFIINQYPWYNLYGPLIVMYVGIKSCELSVLAMSLMGLKKKKKNWIGGWVGGWVELYPIFFGISFLEFF